MATYMGDEALTAIFQIMLDNFLQLAKLKLNGTVITADEDKVIDICPTAEDVSYNRTEGETEITNVNEALEELFQTRGSSTASDTSYDNTTSDLEADNVQDAIDELKYLIDHVSPGGDIPSAEGEAF